MPLEYVLLQLFCNYNLCYVYYYFNFIPFNSIYNDAPQTHHAPTLCTSVAILTLQFTLYVMLFISLYVLHFYIVTFRSVRAVPNMDY